MANIRKPIYFPGMSMFTAYLGAGLPFIIAWLIISRIHLLVAIPAIILYIALFVWILKSRANYKEPTDDTPHHIRKSDLKNISSELMVLHFLAATAFISFIWILYPIILDAAHSKGFIYSFSIPTLPSWAWFITIILSWAYLFTLPIYTSRSYRSWRFNLIIIIMGIYFSLCILSYSISYGHISENGISYRSFSTKFINESIEWKSVRLPARLEVNYWPKNKRWTYNYYLHIQSNNQLESGFKIPFEDNDSGKDSLLKILTILKQNNVPIEVVLAETTQKRVGKEYNLDAFINKVEHIRTSN